MARTTGPLMSVDASGKFGGAMVFSKWKGRNYVRQLVIPKNPKSAKQTGVRAMMKFIADRWFYLTSGNHDTWNDLAESKQISPFNAYVGENLFRWQEFKPPTKEYPADETANAITTTQVLTGGQGFCTIGLTPSGAGDNWGFAIFRDTAEITAPNWNNCIAVIPANGASAVSYTDSPLEAGTYHYRAAVFNTDGKLGTVCADDSEAVT
jgi:hypothetical protein